MFLRTLRFWVRYRWLFQLVFFGVLGLGLYFGMRPTQAPVAYYWMPVWYHIIGLFVCTWLSYLAFPRWRWWVRGGLMFSVGIAIEYVQSLHPQRVADLNDIYANTLGVAAGLITLAICRWLVRRWFSNR